MRSFPMDSHLTALREISGDSMIVDDSDAKGFVKYIVPHYKIEL